MVATVYDIYKLMSTLQQENAMQVQALMTQQNAMITEVIKGMGTKDHMVDSRGIGKPPTYKGGEEKYAEWVTKLLAYIKAQNPKGEEWMLMAMRHDKEVTDEEIETATTWLDEDQESIMVFSVKLYSLLVSITEDDAFKRC